MSQSEILKLLSKNKQLTAKEIATKLDKNVHGVRITLNKLLKYDEVECIRLKQEEVESMGIKYCGKHLVWKLKK